MIQRNIATFCTRLPHRVWRGSPVQCFNRQHPQRTFATPLPGVHTRRHFAGKSNADAAVEELQELYATAKDEFEIAQEETEKKTVYAADDRAAAKEELAKLQEAFNKAVNQADDEEVGKEVTRRVGQRVRELERALEAMEELAMED